MATKPKTYLAVAPKEPFFTGDVVPLDGYQINNPYAVEQPPPPPPEPASLLRRAADTGLSLARGVVGLPEAGVGMLDLVTGGRAGKTLEELGYRPREAKEILGNLQSDTFKQEQKDFENADGVLSKTYSAVSNPSLVLNTAAESLPLMLGGLGVARRVMTAAPKVSGYLAGAIGEGAVGAGSAAESIRQQTADGLLTGKQASMAALAGAGTAAIGYGGAKLAGRFGGGDIDSALLGSTARASTDGVLKRAGKGAVFEGGEEVLQSAQETALQNEALGRPLTEGLAGAAVLGGLSGGAMGAGFNVATGGRSGTLDQTAPPTALPDSPLGSPPADLITDAPIPPVAPTISPADTLRATKVPGTGAMSNAVNAGIEQQAQVLENQAASQPAIYSQDQADAALANIERLGQRDLKDQRDFSAPPSAEPTQGQQPAAEVADPGDLYPVQQGDVLNRLGEPFKNKAAAELTRKARADGLSVVPVMGGFVLRAPEQVVQGAQIATADPGQSQPAAISPAPLPQVREIQPAPLPQKIAQPDAQPDVQNPAPASPAATPIEAQTPPIEAPAPAGSNAAGTPAAKTAARADGLEANGIAAATQGGGTEPSAVIGEAGTPAAAPQRLGRDSIPLSEGGKPYKTSKAATEAKRLQPLMRVVRADGGYALAAKTPAQIAAQEKAATRLASASEGKTGAPQSAQGFIASLGGISPADRAEFSIQGNVRVGNRFLFAAKGKGRSVDELTENLIEAGYLPAGALPNDARALIDRSIRDPQYTAEGFEQIAQAEVAARFEDYEQAQAEQDADFDPFALADVIEQDVEFSDFEQVGAEIQAEIQALLSLAEALNIDTDSILEDAASQTANQPVQGYEDAAVKGLQKAIAGAASSSGAAPVDPGSASQGRQAAQPGSATDSGPDSGQQSDAGNQGAGLTQPTQADVLAQQERAANSQALDERAQIDREASAQTLTQQTAPEQRRDTTADIFGGPTVEEAQAAREREKAARAKPADDGTAPLFSRANEPAASPINIVGASSDLFALPKSDKKTVAEITQENDPKLTVKEGKDATGATEYTITDFNGNKSTLTVRKPSPYGPSVYDMELRDGEGSFDTQRPGENPEAVPDDKQEVYLNVSALTPGDLGTKLYNIAATYAHNNDAIFIGDPAGLSDAAMRRRLENMISSALKFGTTDHLAPHPRQTRGDARLGVPALKWVYGDTAGNIDRMVDVSVKAIENAFPTAKNLSYDLTAQTFRNTVTGRPVPFGGLAYRVGKPLERARGVYGSNAGEAQAGWRTVARNALFRAIQSASDGGAGSGRGRILDGLGRYASSLRADPSTGGAYPKESRIFYSAGSAENRPGITRDQFSAELTKAFGPRVAERLQAKGVVVPLENQNNLPAHVVPFLRDGDRVYGFYDPETNRTYAVLENLTPEAVKGLVLHEVGVHYGFEAMVGADKLAQVYKRLNVMHRMGSKAVRAARASATANASNTGQVQEETLAYLVQNHPELSLVREVIAKIKAFLFREFGIGGKYLTETDLVALARAAVVHSSRTEAGGSFVPQSVLQPQFSLARAALSNLVKLAQSPTNENQTVDLGKVQPAQLALLQREGLPITDEFVHTADLYAVRHAVNRHGDETTEVKAGQLPITETDIAAIPEMLASPDALIVGGKNPRQQQLAGYIKKLSDGGILYFEEVRTGRKTLAMASMRKYPGATDFETILNRVVPSYAQSDTGKPRIVYPNGGQGQEQDGLLSRGTKQPMPTFDNASGNFNPDLPDYWIKQGRKEINGEGMSDADYNLAVAEYANQQRVGELLEKSGFKARGASNVSSSTYYTKDVGFGEIDPEYNEYESYKTYEVRISDHADRYPADDSIESRTQINFRTESANWSDANIGPDLSNEQAIQIIQDALPAEVISDALGDPINQGGRSAEFVTYHVSPLSQFDGTRATSIAAIQNDWNRLDDLLQKEGLAVSQYSDIKEQMRKLDSLEKALKKGGRAFGDNAGIAADSFYASSQPEYWRDTQADELGLSYDNGGIYAVMLKTPVNEQQVASGMGQMAPETEVRASNVKKVLGPFKSKFDADTAVRLANLNEPTAPNSPAQQLQAATSSAGTKLALEDYTDNEVELANIEAAQKGAGAGTKTMKSLTEQADKLGINLMLIPAGDGARRQRLVDFYERFGFQEDGDVMRRRAAPDSGGADIRFSRGNIREALESTLSDARNVRLPAGYLVGDLIGSSRPNGRLSWWHKTVGTQYNLAERSPEFRRVFDGVQRFINDTADYATQASNLAPSILPKLETWQDITKQPLSAQDVKALAGPVFEGTLAWARNADGVPYKLSEGSDDAAGVVWTNAELKDLFKLNEQQISQYREFRAAVDKSLTQLAISDMVRFAGKDAGVAGLAALDSGDVGAAAELLRGHLNEQADANPARAEILRSTADALQEKADRANDLMARGYAPLSRFGQYTVYATEGAEQRYFGMFESQAEANKMARQLRSQFPNAAVQQGTVSQEAYKLFAGVSPETLELFGDFLGLEGQGSDAASQAFQAYIKLAKSNRSTMKRLIARKGIAGFNEDVGRVLAGFVYSNARQTASNLHLGEVKQAVSDIPQGQGEIKDAATRLADYVNNPQEEAQQIRGLLFAQYIGGSIASALVNLTQPLTMTLPYLSQYAGAVGAAKTLLSAAQDAAKAKTGDPELDKALKHAEEQGIVSPQEVHQLMAQAMGRGALKSGDGSTAGNALASANNAWSRLLLAWGKPFSVAEQFNRRTTFIAAWRTATQQGIADPVSFANKAVVETQGIYSKGNKPTWARGAVGGTLFTFKQYSISYVEFLSRLANNGPEGKKAALLALAVLFLLSGAGGLPGADDLDDLIDGLMQRWGYNFSSKAAKREFFAETLGLGTGGADFVLRGVSGLPGVPIDVAGRLGLGNLIPGTGLFTKKTDYTRDVTEFAGPVGDLAKRAFVSAGGLVAGDLKTAATEIQPVAARNLIKAYEMYSTGMYKDARGRKVVDVDGYEALAKAVGFQPNDVARVQQATGLKQQFIALNKIRESEIAEKWALGIVDKDADQVSEARADIKRWNEANPDSPIRIQMGQVLKRVRAMREDKATRIAKTAPKEIRASVKRELAEALP